MSGSDKRYRRDDDDDRHRRDDKRRDRDYDDRRRHRNGDDERRRQRDQVTVNGGNRSYGNGNGGGGGRPKAAPGSLVRVELNSYAVDMAHSAPIVMLRADFGDDGGRAREDEVARRFAMLRAAMRGAPFAFDGGNLVLTLRAPEAITTTVTFKVEHEATLFNMAVDDAPRAEAALSLCLRCPDDVRLGPRTAGWLTGESVPEAPFATWLRCPLVTPMLPGCVVVDTADELVVARDTPALEFVRAQRGVRGADDVRGIGDALAGLLVRVHLGQNARARTFRVLEARHERDISFGVRAHLEKTYGVAAKSAVLLCARRSSDPTRCDVYYPLDLCTVRGSQRMSAGSGEALRDGVKRRNCIGPGDRRRRIQENVARINSTELVERAGLRVSGAPHAMDARILASPALATGAGPMQGGPATTWRPNYRFYEARSVAWALVCERDDERWAYDAFKRVVLRALQECGMRVAAEGQILPWRDMERFDGSGGSNYERGAFCAFVLVKNPVQYRTAKVHFDRVGLVSQCMQCSAKKFAREMHPQYAKMLALKVNVKLGGVNVALPKGHPRLSERRTLVLGFDVYHPPAGSREPSVAALVGSVDDTFQRYRGAYAPCASRKELGTLTADMLEPFRASESPPPPQRVLFYRDGVGKQSIDHVMGVELPVLEAALPGVPLAVVLVTKRHNHRLFKDGGNPDAGTLIMGDGQVLPADTFLLNSHDGILGTSHCSKYQVLRNDVERGTGWTTDDLARISFDLAHLHPRATKAVSMPVPMFQAHLLASRARFHSAPDAAPVRVDGMWWQ